jgi:hypothetical protein
VCKVGVNVGFLYNLSGYNVNCADEYGYNDLPSSAPANIFVNLLHTDPTTPLSVFDDDDGFDLSVYSGAQHDFCVVIYECLTGGECKDNYYFEVIQTEIPNNSSVGPKCMVNTNVDGGAVYVPCGYCGEWIHDCALGYPEKQAHIAHPQARAAQSQTECLYAVGATERSIEIQQCI